MTILFVLLIVTTLFVVTFCIQLFSCIKIFYKVKELNEPIYDCEENKNKFLIKKSYFLQRKFCSNLQSKSFFFKTLYTKEFWKICNKTKFLIDKIYKRLSQNVCQFNFNIDFKRLKSSGLFENKPVFLIYASKVYEKFSQQVFASEKVLEYISYTPIFIFENEKEMFDCKNKIVLSDINPLLLQELNKVNLNYDEKYNISFQIDTDIVCKDKIQVKRHFFDENFDDISYYFFVNKVEKIKIYLKQKDFFQNVKKIIGGIEIVSETKKINYFSNVKILNFNSINYLGHSFLEISLELQKGHNYFLTTNSFDNYKNLCLKEQFFLEKNFNIKIFTKNNYFNKFFNNDLKKKIIDEIYKNNFIKKKTQICLNKNMFLNLFNIDYKELISNSYSYLDFYNFLINEVFGIKINNEKLYVKPKTNVNFKICVDNKSVYVVNKGDETKVDGIVLSNFSMVDLRLIKKNAVINL